jgi:CRP-like cAMP-binding protein/ActR/RegA family two-component response regulator
MVMKTILVVEDNDIIREDVAEMLELANYKVITAINGKEGFELAKQNLPDLIISDIMMPVVDGFGMLHLLRRDPNTEAIPVIFLTSKTERNDFRNAMESGADDFITKPFNNDELLKALENRFKRLDAIKKNVSAELASFNELVESTSNKSLETLIPDRDVRSVQKKQVIYKEGQTPHFLYYIEKGKVRTYKVHEDGKQLSVGLFNEGDFFGHIALLEEAPYKEVAQALEDTELVLIPRKAFENLVSNNLNVAHKLIKMLAKNVAENEAHLLGIAYNTLRKKVAAALTSLYNKYKPKKEEIFLLDISRDELASISGTATESLIRTLTEFKNEGLLDIKKDNKIEIMNAKKLEKLLR